MNYDSGESWFVDGVPGSVLSTCPSTAWYCVIASILFAIIAFIMIFIYRAIPIELKSGIDESRVVTLDTLKIRW